MFLEIYESGNARTLAKETCLPTKTVSPSALTRLLHCSEGNMIARLPGLYFLPLYSKRTPSKTKMLMSRRRAALVNGNSPDLTLGKNRDIVMALEAVEIRGVFKQTLMPLVLLQNFHCETARCKPEPKWQRVNHIRFDFVLLPQG